MNKFRFTINALAVAIFTLAFVSIAQAQASRTWVSGVGDDANPCSRTAPCKTFAGAISKTANFGEIDALDPGGFGAVTITKSITIDGGGGQVASVLTAGTNGILIAGGNSDIITLNNLRFQGLRGSGTPGTNAIKINSALGVHVMNCTIYNWGNNGIDDTRTTVGAFLQVNNTSITNCQNGINVDPGGGASSNAEDIAIANSRIQNNAGSGLIFGSNTKADVFMSVITHNVQAGVLAKQTAGGNTDVLVDHSVVDNNVTGFQTTTNAATIRVSNTNCPHNLSLANNGGVGVISSYGNNQTSGATFPNTGTGQQ